MCYICVAWVRCSLCYILVCMRCICAVLTSYANSHLSLLHTHCSFIVVPTITIPPANVSAFLGENCTFYCEATGEPIPEIVWMFGDTTLSSGDKYSIETDILMGVSSTLVVQSVTPEDEGFYTCNAMNDHGMSSARAFCQPLCE